MFNKLYEADISLSFDKFSACFFTFSFPVPQGCGGDFHNFLCMEQFQYRGNHIHFSVPVPIVHFSGPVPTVHFSGPVPTVSFVGPVPTVHFSGPVPTVPFVGPVPTVHFSRPAVPTVHFSGPCSPNSTFFRASPNSTFCSASSYCTFFTASPNSTFFRASSYNSHHRQLNTLTFILVHMGLFWLGQFYGIYIVVSWLVWLVSLSWPDTSQIIIYCIGSKCVQKVPEKTAGIFSLCAAWPAHARAPKPFVS